MKNCLPFTDNVMVVLVHKCVQQKHLLALNLETLGYILRLLNALNGLVYFLIIGDLRGDDLMVGSISRKLFTELGIRTEDAECKLIGDICNFVNLVLIIEVVCVSTIPRQAIDTPIIKIRSQYLYASFKAKEGIPNASDNQNG